jgi:hypothetical protein
MKCLVLWRYLVCPLQINDAENSLNSQNHLKISSGPIKGILNPSSLALEQNFNIVDTPRIEQGLCPKEMTEIETSKQRPSKEFGNVVKSVVPIIRN